MTKSPSRQRRLRSLSPNNSFQPTPAARLNSALARDMKPRYCTGVGQAPDHLSAIIHDRGDEGRLIFRAECKETAVPFKSKSDLISKLGELMAQRVPLSIGGHCAGPADVVGMLIFSGKLSYPYIEISWTSREHWTLREVVKNVVEWEVVNDPACIANQSFNPVALMRAG